MSTTRNMNAGAAEYKREKHDRRVADRDHSIPRPCSVCGRVVEMCEPDREGLFDDRERVWCEPCAAEALAVVAAAEPEGKDESPVRFCMAANCDAKLVGERQRKWKYCAAHEWREEAK